MFFWWLTLITSSSFLTNFLSRIILCAVVTKPSDESEFFRNSTLNISDVTTTLSHTQEAVTMLHEHSYVSGVYEYESSVNFDGYLRELGVSYILRQLAQLASPMVTISPAETCKDPRNCEYWSIQTDTVFLSHVVRFKLGETGKDTTMDGRLITFTINQSDTNRWVEEQIGTTGGNEYKTSLIRDFYADRMVVTLEVNNVISSSIFRRRMESEEDEFMKKK